MLGIYEPEFYCDECDQKVDEPDEVSVDHKRGSFTHYHCPDCGQALIEVQPDDEPDDCQVDMSIL